MVFLSLMRKYGDKNYQNSCFHQFISVVSTYIAHIEEIEYNISEYYSNSLIDQQNYFASFTQFINSMSIIISIIISITISTSISVNTTLIWLDYHHYYT